MQNLEKLTALEKIYFIPKLKKTAGTFLLTQTEIGDVIVTPS